MDKSRKAFESLFRHLQSVTFSLTANDPEYAHTLFIRGMQTFDKIGLTDYILDCSENKRPSKIALSNAAGFNKNGELSPRVLKALGFERAVIGTVTYDKWNGNPRPRIQRFAQSESLVNWMGLPGIGAKAVADKIASYENSDLPITINLMGTPGKTGDALLDDLENTVCATRYLSNVDRYELNLSCPNTHSSSGAIDARNEYSKFAEDMIDVVRGTILPWQELYLKVSPDLDIDEIRSILEIGHKLYINGYTTTNTTTEHDPKYILPSPEKGGASGNALYSRSRGTQFTMSNLMEQMKMEADIIACGGINSVSRVQERINDGASGIQLFTPIIYSGPQFLRMLREEFKEN